MRVSKRQIELARTVDMYSYLVKNHGDEIIGAGKNRLRLKNHESLVVTRGQNIYFWNSMSQRGDSIKLLMDHFGYDFQTAVISLYQFGKDCDFDFDDDIFDYHRELILPQKANDYKNAFSYLRCRGISDNIISKFIHEGLIYQEKYTNNICFINEGFVETHGSLTYLQYRGIISGSDPDGYWAFSCSNNPKDKSLCYVCESAIDALSLYCVLDLNATDSGRALKPCYFASMAGLKSSALERIKRDFNNHVILCVDNDNGGNNFCSKTSICKMIRLKPKLKDWNEDLLEIRKQSS